MILVQRVKPVVIIVGQSYCIIKAPILGQNLLSDKRIEYFVMRKTQHRDSIGCSDTLDQQAAVEIFIFDSSF